MTAKENRNSDICIFEDEPEGHRLAHVEILVNHIWEKTGCRPLLITSKEVVNSTQYLVFLKKIENRFRIRIFYEFNPRKRIARLRVFLSAVRLMELEGVKRMLIPAADQLIQMIGIGRLLGFKLFHFPVYCGIFRLDAAYPIFPILKRIKHRISFWLQRKAELKSFYYDSYAVEEINRKYGLELTAIPDPLLSMKPNDQVKTGKKSGKRGLCFGTIGRFDSRKGVDLLLSAFEKARLPSNTRLLVAGSVTEPQLLEKIQSAQSRMGSRLSIHIKFLKNDAYRRLLDQMDIVCLPYRSHVGPSGVFAQAAMIGKAVLASDYGWVGSEGRKYNKISFFENESEDSLVNALESMGGKMKGFWKVKSNYQPVNQEKYLTSFCGF